MTTICGRATRGVLTGAFRAAAVGMAALCATAAISTGLLTTTTAARAADPARVTFATISNTSDEYALGVAWSTLLDKADAGVAMQVAPHGGTSKLLRGVVDKDWEIGIIASPHLLYARDGLFMFKGRGDTSKYYDEVRVLLTLESGVAHYVVRAGSGIHTLADLKGKSIALGTPGGFSGTINEALLAAHGLDVHGGDVKGQYVEYATAMDELRNGTMDAVYLWGGLPQGAVASGALQSELAYIGVDDAAMAGFHKTFPAADYYDRVVITPEMLKTAYDGHVKADAPVTSWTTRMQIIVHRDMPDDVAYALVKALWTHIDDVHAASRELRAMTIEGAVQSASGIIHPGAKRFYVEQGVMKP